MLPVHKVIWHEWNAGERPQRHPEPSETMEDLEQVRSYVRAYEWGGPTSALQLHHLTELSRLLRSGDTVVDLACGPGPLLLELAALYPDVHFIGADLSGTMLEHLEQERSRRGLRNVEVLLQDVRTLPALSDRRVDVVISTAALHHLPDLQSLRHVFRRAKELLAAEGAFYLFDFGLLKSAAARKLFVDQVARLAPPLTVRDYELSLQAAFPTELVVEMAAEELPRPFAATRSAFVDLLYFLQSEPRATPSETVRRHLSQIRSRLPGPLVTEYRMIRWLRRTERFPLMQERAERGSATA